MQSSRTYYDITVNYAISRADDIDVIAEGEYARERHDSPTDALNDLGRFIRRNGGAQCWSETDSHEVGSCWLPDGDGTDISFQARLERVTVRDHGFGPYHTTREPAVLTWRRLNAASFGTLQVADQAAGDGLEGSLAGAR